MINVRDSRIGWWASSHVWNTCNCVTSAEQPPRPPPTRYPMSSLLLQLPLSPLLHLKQKFRLPVGSRFVSTFPTTQARTTRASNAWILKFDTPLKRSGLYRKANILSWEPRLDQGNLKNLKFAVKDNIDVAEVPTTAACPSFTYHPQEDSVSPLRHRREEELDLMWLLILYLGSGSSITCSGCGMSRKDQSRSIRLWSQWVPTSCLVL